jgi:hypothetical protein
MSDKFIPFAPAPSASADTPFAAFPLKVLSQVSAKPAFEPQKPLASVPTSNPENCAQPKVSLQRNGDVITGIRIECSCGDVINLSCVY